MATVKRRGHLNVKRVVITALVFILIIAGIVTLICINKNKKAKIQSIPMNHLSIVMIILKTENILKLPRMTAVFM